MCCNNLCFENGLRHWRKGKGIVARSSLKYPTAAPERVNRRHYPDQATHWTDWFVEIRVHHWIKNTLVFAPLAFTPQLFSVDSLTRCLLGFVALSIACSGTYLFNDVLDYQADRQHWSKRRRPVASGRISMISALLAAAGLCTLGLTLALAVDGWFAIFLSAYILMSLAYSYHLKSLALLDLVALATMFSLRIMMGTALIGAAFSPWLPVFVFLFFGGLSTAKRTTELVNRNQRDDHSNNRRCYQEEDLPLLIAFGISFSIGALILLSVFIPTVAMADAMYRSPLRLWIAAPLILIWTLRIWALAVRGNLTDDPVLFALKDQFSIIIGTLIALSLLSIHIP